MKKELPAFLLTLFVLLLALFVLLLSPLPALAGAQYGIANTVKVIKAAHLRPE